MNKTPFTPEQWKAWYGVKSSSELAMEQEEREEYDKIIEAEVDQAREDHYHNHGQRR